MFRDPFTDLSYSTSDVIETSKDLPVDNCLTQPIDRENIDVGRVGTLIRLSETSVTVNYFLSDTSGEK